MAQTFYAQYPASSSGGSNASVGPNGAAIPADSTLIAGENPTGNLQPLQTDASGNLLVSVAAEPGAPIATNLTEVGGAAISEGQKTMANSLPVVIASDQSAIVISGTVIANQGSANATPWNDNVAQWGGSATSLGSKVSASSVPVVIASDQAALPLPTGAATSANQTNASQKTQIVDGSGNVIASTSNALNVQVENFPATQPISGTVAVTQSTSPWVDNISQFGGNNVVTGTGASGAGIPRVTVSNDSNVIVSQATAASLNATVVQGTAANLKTQAFAGTPTAGTVTQAAITVGTTAVRLTVSGSAPSATRSVLAAIVDSASTASFYIGSSSVTNSGATRGVQILAGMPFVTNNDAGDYYIISSTAAQTVYVMEQA